MKCPPVLVGQKSPLTSTNHLRSTAATICTLAQLHYSHRNVKGLHCVCIYIYIYKLAYAYTIYIYIYIYIFVFVCMRVSVCCLCRPTVCACVSSLSSVPDASHLAAIGSAFARFPSNLACNALCWVLSISNVSANYQSCR